VTTDVVFQASDLAGARRREFLSAARDGRALLRDTDGFALAMVPLADLEAVSEIGQAALTLLRAESGLRRTDAHASDLGPLAWLLVFDEEDRAQFVEELSEVFAHALGKRLITPVLLGAEEPTRRNNVVALRPRAGVKRARNGERKRSRTSLGARKRS